jgi:hypothetical protein
LKKTSKIIGDRLEFDFSASIRDVLSNYIGFLVLQPFSESTYKELKDLSAR